MCAYCCIRHLLPSKLTQLSLLTAVQSKAQEDALVVDDNLGFSKDRTISRLLEMQSREYLISHAEHHAPELVMALKEANKNSEAAEAAEAAQA